MNGRAVIGLARLAIWLSLGGVVRGEQRFPPPDFEGGHQLPVTTTPAPRGLWLEYADVVVLAAALGLGSYLVLKKRSRPGVLALSLFSLGYFGFYRQGCVCAIGSVQNLALGLFDRGYAVPLAAVAFFLLPLAVALFAGRSFCAAVCPHGALQDLVLLRPVKVPFWVEQGLGLIPFLYLGAAVAVAATGSAFLICRYDPFVPLFRLSGSAPMLLLGGAILVIGMFVGRPYCRFLCPYGALLKLAAQVSKWRVTITPDVCTRCRLCEPSCPYDAIREPFEAPLAPEPLRVERRRLGWTLLLLPALVAGGGWAGSALSPWMARLHPSVSLSERWLEQRKSPVPLPAQSPAALALNRAEQDPEGLLAQAVRARQNFGVAGWAFGMWAGLVVGVKLAALCLRHRRTDYQPDRGACLACARCFDYCPNERQRRGLPMTCPACPEESVGAGRAIAQTGADR